MREQDPMVRDFTYREGHALVNGFYVGATWGKTPHEYTRETHYWRAGYLFGTLTRYLLVFYVIKSLHDDDSE